MTRTGLLAAVGFAVCMIGLFVWTFDGNVAWAAGGLAVLFTCFLISDALDTPTPKDKDENDK